MTIEAISALSAAQLSAIAAPGALTTLTPSTGVFDSLVATLQNMSTQMTANQQSIQSLALGESDDLHRVIMNLESTKLTFDLALQVRNKVLDAYQELMRMQI